MLDEKIPAHFVQYVADILSDTYPDDFCINITLEDSVRKDRLQLQENSRISKLRYGERPAV